MKRVLFLCSGNYYRSRFAEVLFNWHARERELKWLADSRGLKLEPYNAGPISRHTLSALAERGIVCDSCARYPRRAAGADFATAHQIVAMKEEEHRRLVDIKFPQWRERVEYWHVHDLDCATAVEAIPQLERHVLQLLDRLAADAA